MSLFGTPEEHAANAPSTWIVVKSGRTWRLQTAAGHELETFTTKTAAERGKVDGWAANFYAREGRWFAGETPAGHKSYAVCKAESDRNAAHWAKVEQDRADRAASEVMTSCSCAHNSDGTVTAYLCPAHAEVDPCLTMATVTGTRRKGTIRKGVCSSCGHHAYDPNDYTVHPAYADGTYDGPVGPAHTAPCGDDFYTADDASAHQGHCDQCAGVLEPIMAHRARALEACIRRHPSCASRATS